MKRVFALYLMLCVASAENEPAPELSTTMGLEPEPDSSTPMAGASSTAAPAPTPSPTSAPTPSPTSAPTPTPSQGGDSMNTTTTTEPAVHTFTIKATVTNLSSFANTVDMVAKLKEKIVAKSSTATNENVQVELTALKVKVTHTGFDKPVDSAMVDDIIDATLQMYSAAGTTLNKNQITVNGMNHSDVRRLQSCPADGCSADVVTTVPNDQNAIQTTKAVQDNSKPADFKTKLAAVNPNGNYSSLTLTMSTPKVEMEVKTTVVGTDEAPNTDDVKKGVAEALDVSVDDLQVAVTSTGVVTTPAAGFGDNDHATIVPMMTIWAALYAFVMN